MTHIGYSLTHNNITEVDMIYLGVNLECIDPSKDFGLLTVCCPSHDEETRLLSSNGDYDNIMHDSSAAESMISSQYHCKRTVHTDLPVW